MISGYGDLDKAFRLLGGHLELRKARPVRLVVCGGAALLARGLITRTTQDVDILALLDEHEHLISPAPLPEDIVQAASAVAVTLDLPPDWLDNGPSAGEHGLFQIGLPEGLDRRLIRRDYGSLLCVFFVDRTDLIHFKLYAAAMAGGRHTGDLMALNPNKEELEQAARWALDHAGPAQIGQPLKGLLRSLGYGQVADRL